MPVTRRLSPGVAVAGPAVLLLSLVLTGCEHTSTGLRSALPAQFSQDVSLPVFQNHLLSGSARVEVRLIPGTLTARRVEIEEPRQMSEREAIRSGVTNVSATADQGTLTLELGGLQITFNSATRFRPDDEDANQSDMTLAQFVALVQAELAAGQHPAVTARRSPPTQPQAPDDATFLASEIKLDEGNTHAFIKLNVTGANVITTNQTAPVDATLKVLGLSIALRVSDGTTRLKVENQELEGVREFEGIVQSVDQTARTVTLKDGTIIRIVAGTQIEAKEGDGDEHLTSLAEVQAALTAGRTVQAEGEGLVDTTNPLTFDAIKIEFEVEEPQPPQPGAVIEFQDMVASVDVAHATFTLQGGAVVHVTDHTVIDPAGDLHTLQSVSDELAAHQAVRAEGHATVDAVGPPAMLTAVDVKFETR